ncbi:MAG TPA: family 20 glycosylhydrolase [Saprospiraceae bacterium]|nr:family 20 glycosylhydrolase [Saprospiraceae bacterium]
MKHELRLNQIILLICILAFANCKREAITGPLPEVHLIPKPVKTTLSTESFQLEVGTISAPADLLFEAYQLAAFVKEKAGITLVVSETPNDHAPIQLILDESLKGDEEYKLNITPSQVTLSGKTPAGVFYALQTFRQLLPVTRPGEKDVVTLPCVSIEDQPRFTYRGMHLDVSRHFFDVPVIKRYLDMLARYKFNHFHWHLTDDQGWRVQIDVYPKLNTISSWRNETLIGHHNDQPWKFDGKRHGGYYTKDQIREVIVYAAERHITIVPEIEMPGHSQAVLAAYPEFGCTNNKIEVRKVWSISEDVLCPKEETFKFIEDVLTEVIDLFPGTYIHIGGDECPKTQWEQSAFCQDLMKREGLADEHQLQSWFVQRIERYINSKGRIMIGWDEILEGGLAPNAIVMSWRGNTGGIEAARQAHDVIMTPTTHVYLDYYQSTHPDEPHAIGGFLPLDKVYSFEPIPQELTPDQHKYILGAQANVWTEYIDTPLKLDYMTWPRGIALAEVVWSSADQKNFTDFAERLESDLAILRGEGIYAANHLYELDYNTSSDSGRQYIAFKKILPDIVVNYSNDGEKSWNAIAGPLRIDSSMTLIARSESRRGMKGRPLQIVIDKHLAVGKNIVLINDPAPQYNNGGIQSLVNGIKGSDVRYGDKEWRGFSGMNLDATIDLGSVISVSSVETRCFQGQGQRIYLPGKIEVSFSKDGTTFLKGGEMEKLEEAGKTRKAHAYRMTTSPTEARYIRVVATNFGRIPEGMQGVGNEAWLFVDEISVK